MPRSSARYFILPVLFCLLGITVSFAGDQAKYKMTTPFAPGVAVPDKVETSIGTLNLNYGYPDDATTQKVYDNLDASRALYRLTCWPSRS